MRPVQYFSDEYLKQTGDATPEQILEYLERFRLMQASSENSVSQSKLISLKVNKNLLKLFRTKCEITGIKYQTQIKTLMMQWVD